ncbi:hypothetical protein CZ771_06970 [Actinomycetales bacterium JB111]|nr:hypothetical protein CZ771_06970 [Actinomycetales bacterium JB111]
MTTTTLPAIQSPIAREADRKPPAASERHRKRRSRMSADLGRDLGALAMVTVLASGVLAAVIGAFAGAVHVVGPTVVDLLG